MKGSIHFVSKGALCKCNSLHPHFDQASQLTFFSMQKKKKLVNMVNFQVVMQRRKLNGDFKEYKGKGGGYHQQLGFKD